MNGAAYVYRTYDLAGTLLYVGCSVSPEARMRTHEQVSPWWPFHVHVTYTEFATRGEAAKAEIDAIRTEYPRWNIAGRAVDHPDGPVFSRFGVSHLAEEVSIWREWRSVHAERARLTVREERLEDRVASVASGLFDAARMTAAHP